MGDSLSLSDLWRSRYRTLRALEFVTVANLGFRSAPPQALRYRPLRGLFNIATMISVALICTANRCRSVMAHAILAAEVKRRRLPVEVYSAGVFDFRGAPAIDDTTRTCELHQTPAPSDVATWVRDLPLDSITRFLVMEKLHGEVLTEEYGIEPERVSLLGEFDPQQRGAEIADPYSRGRAVYEQSYDQIHDCIIGYLDATDDLGQD